MNFEGTENVINDEDLDEYSCIVKKNNEGFINLSSKRKKSKLSKAISNAKIEESNNNCNDNRLYMEDDIGHNDLYHNLGTLCSKNTFLPSKENCQIEDIYTKDIITPISKDKEDFFNNEDYNQEKYFSLSKSRRRTRNDNDDQTYLAPDNSEKYDNENEDLSVKKGKYISK